MRKTSIIFSVVAISAIIMTQLAADDVAVETQAAESTPAKQIASQPIDPSSAHVGIVPPASVVPQGGPAYTQGGLPQDMIIPPNISPEQRQMYEAMLAAKMGMSMPTNASINNLDINNPAIENKIRPMIEKLLGELAIKYSIFEEKDANLSKEPLTNEEIDSIFITFSAEKEKLENLEKLKEAEKEKLEKMQKRSVGSYTGNPNADRYTVLQPGATPVYPRNANNPLTIGPGKGFDYQGAPPPLPEMPKQQEQEPEPEIAEVPDDFSLSGISCTGRDCIAYTADGILKKGDEIFGEKIIAITKSGIKTKNHKIPFN